MRKTKFAALISVLILTSSIFTNISVATADSNLYVSLSGNDKNPGSISKPFRTIKKCATTAQAGQVCNLRAGTYLESVKPNSGITIQSYKDEIATIDGRDLVTGFKSYGPDQYVAHVTLGTGDFNQIFFGSSEGTLAKWPNGGDTFHPKWAQLQEGSDSSQIVDSGMPNGIKGTGVVKIWSGEDAWYSQSASFINPRNGKAAIGLSTESILPYIVPRPGGLYYLYNNLSLMDSPFEWYYDIYKSQLYVQLPKGQSIAKTQVYAKMRDTAIDLRGANNVTIKGIQLFASTITSDLSSHDNLIDGIKAQYVSHYTRVYNQDDRVFDLGLMVKGTNSTLKNSIIDNSSCDGVIVDGSHNTVTNNLISNVGSVINDCTGIFIVGDGHSITHNTVYNAGRSAIFPTRIGTPSENFVGNSPTNLDISYNDLFHVGLLGNDIGAIYMGGGIDTGLKIHHNWLHDSRLPAIHPQTKIYPITLAGVYLDNNTSGADVYQNVLWALDQFPLFINGDTTDRVIAPNNNLIHNNSIPDTGLNANITQIGPVHECGTTKIYDNKVKLPTQTILPPVCPTENNSINSVGANEMDGVIPGCTLKECLVADPYKVPSW